MLNHGKDTKLKTSAGLVLKRQTELPEFVVPDWAKLLTGGVDVQQDCMYWTIRAWGDFITSQNIAHGQVYSFDDIENIMNLQYMTESGKAMVVNLCLVDSGFDTDNVYDFCAYNSDWALPCKGSSNPMENHFLIKTVNKDYSKAYGMNLVVLDGGRYKDMIAGRMHRPNGRGSWMVYKGCDMEYAEQVTSEHKVNIKTGSGKVRQEWTPNIAMHKTITLTVSATQWQQQIHLGCAAFTSRVCQKNRNRNRNSTLQRKTG